MIAYNWFDCDKQPQSRDRQRAGGLRRAAAEDADDGDAELLPFFEWVAASSAQPGDQRVDLGVRRRSSRCTCSRSSVIGGAVLSSTCACSASACRISRSRRSRGTRSRGSSAACGDARDRRAAVRVRAEKCYYSTPFRVKMLAGARDDLRVHGAAASRARGRRARSPICAEGGRAVSLALWFGVGAGGRWIGFSGNRSFRPRRCMRYWMRWRIFRFIAIDCIDCEIGIDCGCRTLWLARNWGKCGNPQIPKEEFTPQSIARSAVSSDRLRPPRPRPPASAVRSGRRRLSARRCPTSP